MPTLRIILHSLISRLILMLVLIAGFPVILLMIILPKRYRYRSTIVFRGVQFFYWSVIKSSFVPVRYEGKEHIPQEPVIYAANHSSSIDIPLVGILTRGKPHVWLAKADLMEWRFLKWVLPRLAVLVDVTSREKSMSSMLNLMRLVQNIPIDVMIFPEGTRHADDQVHKFYGGFVTLAKMLKRPVVPVYIAGANRVYPPGTFWVTPHPIKVVIGKPFTIQDGETDGAFKERVHSWFIKEVEK